MCERFPNGPTPPLDEAPAGLPPTVNPYQFIEAVANIRIEQLKALGLLQRESQISDEEELDDHFAALTAEFAFVAGVFGLPWPPVGRDPR